MHLKTKKVSCFCIFWLHWKFNQLFRSITSKENWCFNTNSPTACVYQQPKSILNALFVHERDQDTEPVTHRAHVRLPPSVWDSDLHGVKLKCELQLGKPVLSLGWLIMSRAWQGGRLKRIEGSSAIGLQAYLQYRISSLPIYSRIFTRKSSIIWRYDDVQEIETTIEKNMRKARRDWIFLWFIHF